MRTAPLLLGLVDTELARGDVDGPANRLDERVAALLMLARYRAGRQARALAVFGTTRAALAEELGVDPRGWLRRLHGQILSTDPALLYPAAGDERPTVVAPPVPRRQLPAPPAHFTGRSRELALLDEALGRPATPGGSAAVAVVDGAGGIGKTWLALRWAHRTLDLFPTASSTPPAKAVRRVAWRPSSSASPSRLPVLSVRGLASSRSRAPAGPRRRWRSADRIMVGRSTSVNGPYVDRDGTP